MRLNVEEMYFMTLFDTSSRQAAVRDILRFLPYAEEGEFMGKAKRLILKISSMSDEEFAALDFSLYKSAREGEGHD